MRKEPKEKKPTTDQRLEALEFAAICHSGGIQYANDQLWKLRQWMMYSVGLLFIVYFIVLIICRDMVVAS